MRDMILVLADIVNEIHDILVFLFGGYMTDKELHFWIIGIIGIILFAVVHFFFQLINKLKWSVFIFSFIYTFTGIVVIVFAIELQQAITNRGNMEFADAVAGIWGFLAFSFVYAVIGLLIYSVKKWIFKRE